MSRRVLIIPDKFKGTLSALAAAEAIARGWRTVRPQDTLELLPMSDGGDGFGEVLSRLLQAERHTVATVDAAHRPLQAHWWWEPRTQTAIIESAQVIGLARLPPGRFHPFQLDTFGLGAVLRAAADRGARRCVMGIGGSATNDGGFGIAQAMGWEFGRANGEPIHHWTELETLAQLRAPPHRRWFNRLRVAVDVQNPLLGPKGATRVYGPQKGLTPDDFPLAERCLIRLREIVKIYFQKDYAGEAGAGAAGGLGFGLRCFLRAELRPGFALFARYARLSQRLRAADIVVTGEGAIDASTLMGKGVGEIARLCHRLNLPCLGMAGHIANPNRLAPLFTLAGGLVPDLTAPDAAKAQPAFWLARLAAQVAARFQPVHARRKRAQP